MITLLRLLALALPLILFGQVRAQVGSAHLLNTKKIALIHVGPSKGLSESSFGHVALRLSPTAAPGLLDIVVEFVADIPENEAILKKYAHGIGIGGKYPMIATVSSFLDFKKLKTIVEDRPLTVYDVDLSETQVASVVKFILDYQNQVTEADYTFFKNNCSFFANLALERALGQKLKRKFLPWAGPKELKKSNLVLKESLYPAGSTERARFAEKFLADGLGDLFPYSSWKVNFVSDLKEMDFLIRQVSYLKLLWVLQGPRASESEKKKIQALFRYLVAQEEEASSYVLKNMFKDPEKKKVLVSKLVDLESQEILVSRGTSLTHELRGEKGKLWVHASWRNVQNTASASIPFSQLALAEAGTVTFGSRQVGRFVRVNKKAWFLSQHLDYAVDVVESPGSLQALVYVDTSESLRPMKKDLAQHKALSHLALNNARDFEGEVGSCYAMTLLQKAFMERAIFLPGVPANPSQDKLAVMKALMEGSFAVIPGYSSIHQFTASVEKETFKNFVRGRQALLQKGRLAQMIENVTKRELITEESIQTLKSLTDEGLFVPMIIAMTKKGTMKVAAPYAHAVLVMNVEELGGGNRRLTIYDPNTNINTLLTMNKDFKLSYPFYGKDFDYIGVLDSLSEYDINLDHAVRSREVNLNLLKGTAGKGMILGQREVTKILK